MAIKGIGFNDSNIKNQTIATGQTLEIDGDVTVAEGLTVSAGGAAISGNSSISGNLTVSGSLISQDEYQVLIKDNFLDLNFGNVGTSYEQTGLTFNYQAVTGKVLTINTTSNNVNFTNADGGTTRATIVADTAGGIPSATFAEGDIIQVNGTTNGDNDGIYVVHENATAGTLTLKSSNLASPDTVNAAFALLTLTTEEEATSTSLTIAKVNVMALRSSNTGTLESAQGAADSSFSSYSAVGAASSLQDAYDTGATITTASSTDLAFTLTSGDFTVDGGGAVTMGASTALSSFAVATNGNSGGDIVISEAGASGSIQIEVNSGTVLEAKDGALDLNTDVDFGKATGSAQVLTRTSVADGDDLTIQLAGANNASIILQSAGTGNDAIFLDATAGGFDIAGAIDSKILVTTGALEVGTFTSGDLTLSTTTAGDIIATAAEAIDIDAGGAIDILAGGAFSIDGTGASNVSATSGNLTISTLTSGTLAISSVAALDIDGTATTLDATTLSIDSTDTTNLTMTADDGSEKVMTISATNSGAGNGNIDIDADERIDLQLGGTSIAEIIDFGGGQTGLQVQQNSALVAGTTGGFQFGPAATVNVTDIKDEDNMSSDSATALATQQSIKAYVDSRGISDFESVATLTADEAIAVGKLVAIKVTGGNEGRAILADADSIDTCRFVGICISAAAGQGNTCIVAQVGVMGGFSGLTAGNIQYVSTTAGDLTTTAPSGTGDVIHQVGYAISTTKVLIAPQFIMELG